MDGVARFASRIFNLRYSIFSFRSSILHFRFSILHYTFALAFALFLPTMTLSAAAVPQLVIRDEYRSPRNKERPLRKSTRIIVLHTTEAHAKSSLNKLSERGEAHYCVTDAGEVYRIIDRDREAYHAGRSMWNAKEDCDEFSIGIEVVGHHDHSMPLRQLEALRQLVKRLQALYGIADAQVVCHSHVAYGAPNTWYKKKHRGRKRCGMLFAMPSVRAKLGLAARPASDPDVKAKRLIQADAYLDSILYGKVDTMVAIYGKGRAQVGVLPKTAISAAPAPAKPVAAKSAVARSVPAKTVAPAKSVAAAKPVARPVSKPVVKSAAAKVVAPAEQEQPEESGWLANIGLGGGYFKKKAKLVVPEPVETAQGDADESVPEVLPLPPNLHIGKKGDDVKDLAALAKLPGYTRGGPVGPDLSPFKIAGSAWKSPATYYYNPRGQIITGDKVDEKSIEPGTFVFYRK